MIRGRLTVEFFQCLLMVLLLLVTTIEPSIGAPALQPIPPMTARVKDLTGTLSDSQKQALEKKLTEFETRKGSQIAVLMLGTTQPEAIEQYALRVASQWKLGRKKVDDGVLLVVAKEDRNVRIEVGYGLEGPLNDATCKRLISDFVLPSFRQGNYYEGIDVAVTNMIRVIDGEPLAKPAVKAAETGLDLFFLLLPFGVIFILLLAGGFWPGVLWAIFTLGSGRSSNGNGFKGGGGGFGGGGASGRW
ncbi:MAG: TPM domain-containing protein [Burkholderiales bacterium]|jgi:uncharacterized protein|nr:TPM domain-containing protein [Burkholderiales bacterium]